MGAGPPAPAATSAAASHIVLRNPTRLKPGWWRGAAG